MPTWNSHFLHKNDKTEKKAFQTKIQYVHVEISVHKNEKNAISRHNHGKTNVSIIWISQLWEYISWNDKVDLHRISLCIYNKHCKDFDRVNFTKLLDSKCLAIKL